jgi:hypothetical protein
MNATKSPTCISCGIEIAGRATVHDGSPFCCTRCLAGGPCTCSYGGGSSDAQVRHCLDIRGALENDVTHRARWPVRRGVPSHVGGR